MPLVTLLPDPNVPGMQVAVVIDSYLGTIGAQIQKQAFALGFQNVMIHRIIHPDDQEMILAAISTKPRRFFEESLHIGGHRTLPKVKTLVLFVLGAMTIVGRISR